MAQENAKKFKENDLKTSQIRNFFSAVLKIKNDYNSRKSGLKVGSGELRTQLILLKPKLAYAAGRQPRSVTSFKEFMDDAIDAVIKSHNFEDALDNFFTLIESVVAYHKFYGGKD